ncbi:MAG: hypothetical protein ACLRXQ_07710 [Phascolarctobacterium faecium]
MMKWIWDTFMKQKYFANILCHMKLIDKALAKAAALDLKMIATAHGIIWRSHIQEIMPICCLGQA